MVSGERRSDIGAVVRAYGRERHVFGRFHLSAYEEHGNLAAFQGFPVLSVEQPAG